MTRRVTGAGTTGGGQGMARLVGYLRVSTSEQLEGFGLDVQEQSIS